MKKVYIIAYLVCAHTCFVFAQGVSINDNGALPDTSAILDVSSQNKGVLIPRMNTADRDDIDIPANGLLIFNTDSSCFEFFTNNTWNNICSNAIVYLQDSTQVQSVCYRPLYIGTHHVRYDVPLMASAYTLMCHNYISMYTEGVILVYGDDNTPHKRRVVTDDWSSASSIRSVSVVESSLYVLLYSSSLDEYRVYRYNTQDIYQGAVQVNIIGYNISTSNPVFMSGASNALYFSWDAGNSSDPNSFARFSMTSPINIQYESTVTYGSGFETNLFGVYNDLIFIVGKQSGLMQVFQEGNTVPIYMSTNVCTSGNALDGILVWGSSVYIYNESYRGYSKILDLQMFD